MELSDEQREIIASSVEFNVAVDSVAGSGKTTTILHLAQHHTCKTLILTYNHNLKKETRDKITAAKMDSYAEAHSYHSFAVKYLAKGAYRDSMLKKALDKDFNAACAWELIVLDEVQDLTPLLYRLVKKIIRACVSEPKICLFGDRFQAIYGYSGADSRFLAYANLMFPSATREWSFKQLSTSYRITNEMAEYLNNTVLHNTDRRIRATKSIVNSSQVEWYNWDTISEVGREIVRLIRSGAYLAEDIFVLSPSVKSRSSPVSRILNVLVDAEIPVLVTNLPDVSNREDIFKNKVVFTTFHKAKGLERKMVVVVGFDNNYYKFYGRNENRKVCPNIWYVALTRAIKKLLVVSFGYEHIDKMPFLKGATDNTITEEVSDAIPTSVTRILEHVKSDVISNLVEHLKLIYAPTDRKTIVLPATCSQVYGGKNIKEQVADIHGCLICIDFVTRYKNIGYDCDWKLPQKLEWVNKFQNELDHMLYYRVKQITKYNWLKTYKSNITECIERLERVVVVEDDTLFMNPEHEIMVEGLVIEGVETDITISGRVDLLQEVADEWIVWEFKCTKGIEDTHILQVVFYGYLFYKERGILPKMILYNVCMDTKIQIEVSVEKVIWIVQTLIRAKFDREDRISDELFIQNMLNI